MTGGLWEQPDVPQRGWHCVSYCDLEEATHVCDMCGTEEIRYVHTMAHPSHPKTIEVGCVCAEKLELPYERGVPTRSGPRPKHRERSMMGRARRRSTWCTRTWRESARGGLYLRTGGRVFTITPYGSHWRASAMVAENEWVNTSGSFDSIDAAKLAIFDRLWPPKVQLT